MTHVSGKLCPPHYLIEAFRKRRHALCVQSKRQNAVCAPAFSFTALLSPVQKVACTVVCLQVTLVDFHWPGTFLAPSTLILAQSSECPRLLSVAPQGTSWSPTTCSTTSPSWTSRGGTATASRPWWRPPCRAGQNASGHSWWPVTMTHPRTPEPCSHIMSYRCTDLLAHTAKPNRHKQSSVQPKGLGGSSRHPWAARLTPACSSIMCVQIHCKLPFIKL